MEDANLSKKGNAQHLVTDNDTFPFNQQINIPGKAHIAYEVMAKYLGLSKHAHSIDRRRQKYPMHITTYKRKVYVTTFYMMAIQAFHTAIDNLKKLEHAH